MKYKPSDVGTSMDRARAVMADELDTEDLLGLSKHELIYVIYAFRLILDNANPLAKTPQTEDTEGESAR